MLAVKITILTFSLFMILIGTAFGGTFVGSQQGVPNPKSAARTGANAGLCASIPAEYNAVFSGGGGKWNVQAAFVGAIFVGEHRSVADSNYSKWPDPTGPWASSPQGAKGPFQFIDPTWAKYQEDGDGDGTEDVQNLSDAAHGAAHYLSAIGAGDNTTDLDKLREAASRYNSGKPWSVAQHYVETAKYVPRVIEAFKAFYCPEVEEVFPVELAAGPRFSDDWLAERGQNWHAGNDIIAPAGSKVIAIVDGMINNLGDGDTCPGDTWKFTLDGGGGRRYYYAHVRNLQISEGSQVAKGQVIAEVAEMDGTSCNVDHLHFGVKVDRPKECEPPYKEGDPNDKTRLFLDVAGNMHSYNEAKKDDSIAYCYSRDTWWENPYELLVRLKKEAQK